MAFLVFYDVAHQKTDWLIFGNRPIRQGIKRLGCWPGLFVVSLQSGRLLSEPRGDNAYFVLLSGTQLFLSRSYLNPGAFLSSSLVVSIVRCTLLSFTLDLIELKFTATSFSPAPRKPPTPTIAALIWPPLGSTRKYMISPILLLFGS